MHADIHEIPVYILRIMIYSSLFFSLTSVESLMESSPYMNMCVCVCIYIYI